jgi:hypothetical protein
MTVQVLFTLMGTEQRCRLRPQSILYAEQEGTREEYEWGRNKASFHFELARQMEIAINLKAGTVADSDVAFHFHGPAYVSAHLLKSKHTSHERKAL